MAGRIGGVSIVACISLSIGCAQNRTGPTQVFDCAGRPHVVALDGTISAEYRNWDPDLCAPPARHQPSGGLVSARSFTHKVPKAAAKEFDRGLHARTKGENELAKDHLAEAVRLDPGFVEARFGLAMVYANLGQPQEALEQYDKALALEPNVAVLHGSKAAALVMISRWEEAEAEARTTLRLDPNSIEAHYMLGVALFEQAKISPETESHLAIAAKKYERARPYLAAAEAALASPVTNPHP
jgi:tetratricopeptide (TPR) repeat protein